MAITINSVPAPYHSLHDDTWFVLSSTNSAATDFKYIFDVYIAGTLVSRVKAVPDPITAKGIFNPAPIVRNYIENYFKPNSNSVLQFTTDNIHVDYDVRFGEEVSGTLTTNLASGSYGGYNSYPPVMFDSILMLGGGDGDLLLSDQYENLLLGNYADQWLTDRDTERIEVVPGKRLHISWLADLYNAASVSVVVGGVTHTGAIMELLELSTFNFSAANLNTYIGSEVITDSTESYRVYLNMQTVGNNLLYSVQQMSTPDYLDCNIKITNNTLGLDVVEEFLDATGVIGAAVGDSITVTCHVYEDWTAAGFNQLRVQKNGIIQHDSTASGDAVTRPSDLSYTFTVEAGAIYKLQARSRPTGGVQAFATLTGGSASANDDLTSNELLINQVCYPKTNPMVIHFLNMQGGWDSFGFNLVNKRASQFERSSYQKSEYQLSGNDMRNIDDYNKYNDGKVTFATNISNTYHLISDWCSEKDYHWLAQLIASPIVYLEVRGAYFPVLVTNTSYEYKLEASDQLFNFEIDVQVGKKQNSQYR